MTGDTQTRYDAMRSDAIRYGTPRTSDIVKTGVDEVCNPEFVRTREGTNNKGSWRRQKKFKFLHSKKKAEGTLSEGDEFQTEQMVEYISAPNGGCVADTFEVLVRSRGERAKALQ